MLAHEDQPFAAGADEVRRYDVACAAVVNADEIVGAALWIGNDIAVESQAAKLRLVIETAREVWGGV